MSIIHNKRIISIVGAGLIGSNLVRTLTEHNKVVVFSNLLTELRNQVSVSVKCICGDIWNREATQQAMTNADGCFTKQQW
jgi:nucleoside-diphosphate-sugar epimerase